MTGPAARRIAGDGVELAAYQWGASTAPAVVLVHGYPDTSAVWRPVAERLADQFHVTAFDVRGAGASHRPRGLRAYRMSRLEADLEAVLDAVSPDRPVHLVGHDWGSIHSWDRADQQDPAWRRLYAVRSGVEGTIAELAHGHRARRCRYHGLPKTHVQHVLTAIAVNIERLIEQDPQNATYRPRRPTAFQQFLVSHGFPRPLWWRQGK
ncbi:alpha/beta fold hydrolase [Streptomyces sp. NBC_01478]|uniref:alpha/beta fold hydrolase n=1 Tax=Streptomyces sp. NBC_01478 TaxID=2903882 RepID=UPI002E331F5F|nr:alpha/beta fold hydrolase [Streptomyces sp. NBC_01478]